MKRKLVNTLWAMGLLAVVSLCLFACDREPEVQQAYDFTLETMPVQKDTVGAKRPRYDATSSEMVAFLKPAILFATSKARVRAC